jgi:Na+/citrate or Na+/malate symporter
MKTFFVVVLMTGSVLGMYSNCLVAPGEEPSPISGYFRFGSLVERLVVGFLSGIVPAT